MKKTLVVCFLLGLILVPAFVYAQGTVGIPCDGVEVPCKFEHFMQLISNVLNFLILLSIPLGTLAFAWAGWLMLMSEGNPSKKEDAKEIFKNVGIGLILMLTAWLIVNTIMSALVDDDAYINLLGVLIERYV